MMGMSSEEVLNGIIGAILIFGGLIGFFRFLIGIQEENYQEWRELKEEETDMLASKINNVKTNVSVKRRNHHDRFRRKE